MRGVTVILLVGALGLLFTACTSKTQRADLADGDTVTFVKANRGHEIVLEKDGARATLRLVGVYTFDPRVPNSAEIQSLAESAVDFLESRYQGERLTLQLERAALDPRGRYLGFLHAGEQDINVQMLSAGQAAVYTEFPFSREETYFQAERPARTSQKGIWRRPRSRERIAALRTTWAAVHARRVGSAPPDPLMAKDP